ncbi:MAG TPA: hypothetical protein VMW50_06380 [Dehalococcoidia bacterium]|nr:hypothetical protein [Dehalococcoidia bacterium]
MELWKILELAFALAAVSGCIALIINRFHLIERAEDQEWRNYLIEAKAPHQ